MKVVHPFDFLELSQGEPLIEQVGLTGIPVMGVDDTCYLSSASIHRIKNELYLVTTTVPAKTKNFV